LNAFANNVDLDLELEVGKKENKEKTDLRSNQKGSDPNSIFLVDLDLQSITSALGSTSLLNIHTNCLIGMSQLNTVEHITRL